jgi:rod shape-determining protein MreD
LLLDVLLFTLIGEHMFALVWISWIASRGARRFPLWNREQQIFWIACLCFGYQIVLFTIDGLSGFHVLWWRPLASSLMSVLIWPWASLLLNQSLGRESAGH